MELCCIEPLFGAEGDHRVHVARTPGGHVRRFHENLAEATTIAVEQMLDLLITEKHLDRSDAYILASNAMNLRITQLVDGKVGVHALLPKAIFKH